MSDLLSALRAEIGLVRHSDWLTIDQSMINRFADVTLDHQYIHVDPERAANTSFGGTLVHGFLTLSLLSRLYETADRVAISRQMIGINYGFDRIRFVQPVRSGRRIRASFTRISIEEKRPGQFQQMHDAVVGIEGVEKPALVAVWLSQLFV
jgi:acyl dehydratase